MHLRWSSTPLFCIWYCWDFSVCLWYLPHTWFAQIARPSATRFIRVFDDDGNEVLSAVVYTSADAIYSNDTVTLTTSTSFFTNRTYYLLADAGVCVCLYEVCMCAYVCVHVCVHVNGQTGRQTCVHTRVHACVYTNLPGCLYHYAYTYCTYRCCCCECILPYWVSCRHPS